MDHDEIVDFVRKHGRQYKSALCPKYIRRGPVGRCFDTSILAAFDATKPDRKIWYVEGIAENPKDYDEWIYHAWVTDGVHAFDPTWRAYADHEETIELTFPIRYIGIQMEPTAVAAFMLATEHQAILKNGSLDIKLARNCVPSYPLARALTSA
jgi:hypothetical protein